MVAIEEEMEKISVEETDEILLDVIAHLKMARARLMEVKKSRVSFDEFCNSDEMADLFDAMERLQLALTYSNPDKETDEPSDFDDECEVGAWEEDFLR